MYTLITLCCSLGFYLLYNTSKKASLNKTGKINRVLQQHRLYTQIGGCALLLLTFVLQINHDGYALGFLTALVLLMAVGGLIVILAPLQLIRWTHLIALFTLLFISELLIF